MARRPAPTTNTSEAPAEQLFLSAPEVAEILGVSRTYPHRYIRYLFRLAVEGSPTVMVSKLYVAGFREYLHATNDSQTTTEALRRYATHDIAFSAITHTVQTFQERVLRLMEYPDGRAPVYTTEKALGIPRDSVKRLIGQEKIGYVQHRPGSDRLVDPMDVARLCSWEFDPEITDGQNGVVLPAMKTTPDLTEPI